MSNFLLQNKTNRKNEHLTPTKKSKTDINSFGSGNYIFETKDKKYTLKYISNFELFSKNCSLIFNPSYTINSDYLEKNTNLKKEYNNNNNLEKEFILNFSILNLNKEDIFQLDNKQSTIDFFNKKNKKLSDYFIFSNTLENEKEKELQIFKNLKDYCNGYWREVNIKEFCYDYKIIFENNNDPIFYSINKEEDFVYGIKHFHYFNKGISHFYSSKKSGKSLVCRSIIKNFTHPENLSYYPFIIFDIKILNNLLKSKNNKIKKVILHELYNIFRDFDSALLFYQKLNFEFENVMIFILDIITKILIEVKEKKLLFILDGYSEYYDKEKKYLHKIDRLVCCDYFLYINHDILTYEDSNFFYYNFNPVNYVNYFPEYGFIISYYPEIKTLNTIDVKNYTFPIEYYKFFGENVSYFFEYECKKNKINFIQFVEQKKSEIKKEIKEFIKTNFNIFEQLKKINEIIINHEKIIYSEIISYIPLNYIKIEFVEKPPNGKYYFTNSDNVEKVKNYYLYYSFPLVKNCIEELLNKESYFLNIKDPEFLKLPGQIIGLNFDYEMNEIFKKSIQKEKFFNHQKKILKFINEILDKNSSKKDNQIYKEEEVINFLNNNKEYKIMKNEFSKINFNDYSLILILQNNYSGKAFDILLFIKDNNEEYYNMELIQIKCSDNYIEDEKKIPFQVQYVKIKFIYLLNIDIMNCYLKYLSIFELPKSFVTKNKDKSFLYNINENKFVDFSNNEYINYPNLPESIIKNIDEYQYIEEIESKLFYIEKKKIKLTRKKYNNNFENKKKNEILNLLNKNEVFMDVRKDGFNYYFNYKNNKGYNEFNYLKFNTIEFKRLYRINYLMKEE